MEENFFLTCRECQRMRKGMISKEHVGNFRSTAKRTVQKNGRKIYYFIKFYQSYRLMIPTFSRNV